MDFSFKDFSWQYFNFEDYALLSLGLLVILFLLFEYFPGRNYFYSLNQLKKFIDKHLISHLLEGTESKKRSWLRMVFVSLIWLFLVLALANPRWNFEEIESYKPNINLVILLDISKSMDAADEKPSRLERAKQEIVDIIKKAQATNIGIMAFANQAHIISPVTDDKNALMYLLPSINTDLVGVQGSNITAGIKAAKLLLKPMKGGINYILVISDGGFEDNVNFKSLKSSAEDIKILTFGVGKTEGAPIPDENGKFIEDEGKTVLTKLEKDNLIKLSGLENYIQGSYLDDDTQKIVKILSSQIDVSKQRSKLQKIWQDRFYIPLSLAALLLMPFFRRGAIFPVILIMLFAQSSLAQEPTPEKQIEVTAKVKSKFENIKTEMFKNNEQQAQELYEDKKYQEAKEKFTITYNQGTASFKDKDYAAAEEYFSQDAESNIESEYNLGNAQLMQMKIKDAIKTYESVLKKDPNHEDAKHNLEIAKKLQQNPKNKNKDKSNNSKDKNKDKNKDQNNKDSKNQDNQGKQNNKQDKNDQKDSGKPDDKKDQNNDKKEGDKQNKGEGQQNPDEQKQGGEQQGDNNSQETIGNNNKKELDIQAKSILSKISSDPEKLMKGRFKYEEGKGGAASTNNKNPKPW